MSSDIKRIGWHGVNGMQDDVNGDYVLHSDHEAAIDSMTAALVKLDGSCLASEQEVARLRAEVEGLRDLLPEASICVQYAIDYGAPSRQSDRRDLLGKIDAAMGEGK